MRSLKNNFSKFCDEVSGVTTASDSSEYNFSKLLTVFPELQYSKTVFIHTIFFMPHKQ